MRIDVHAHYYTEATIQRLEALGSTFAAGTRMAPSADVSLPRRIELLDRAGIDLQVLCAGGLQPYFASADKAIDGATYLNDAYAGAVSEGHGRLAAFGCVPLPHVDAAIAEASRCLDELRFPGLNLGCSIAAQPLDDPAFEPFWAEMDRRRAVVFLHSLRIGAPADYGLDAMIGHCFEDTISALRLVMSGLVSRYPGVSIIVGHLGGTIPYLWGRLRRGDIREGLKQLYYDSTNSAPGMFCPACRLLGPERIMLGSDFPYMAPDDFPNCVTHVQQSGLTEDEIGGILDRNAQTLLRL